MSDPRCAHCKYWTDDEASWEAEGVGFKRCAAVRERWRIQDAVDVPASAPTEEWTARRREALKASRAYVEDGSEYKALLWTAPDFFCALFEAPPQEPKP